MSRPKTPGGSFGPPTPAGSTFEDLIRSVTDARYYKKPEVDEIVSNVLTTVLAGGTGSALAPSVSGVTISGTVRAGQALTALSTIAGNPAPTVSYQWKLDNLAVAGATASTFTPSAAGRQTYKKPSVVVTATNGTVTRSAESPQGAEIATDLTEANFSSADTIMAKDWVPTYNSWVSGGKYFGHRGKKWIDYNAQKSYSVLSDGDKIRFESRQGDFFIRNNSTDSTDGASRNKIGENNFTGAAHALTDVAHLKFRFRLASATVSAANWWQLLEIHQFNAVTPNYASAFELMIAPGDVLYVNADYHSGTQASPVRNRRELYRAGSGLARGVWHEVELWVKQVPGGTTGRIVVDLNGTRVVNFTGAVGFFGTNDWTVEHGIYRHNATGVEAQILDWVWDRTLPFEFGPSVTIPT